LGITGVMGFVGRENRKSDDRFHPHKTTRAKILAWLALKLSNHIHQSA